MTNDQRVMIRPGINVARGEYASRRTAELHARKRQLREQELERLERRLDRLDRLDLELTLERNLLMREEVLPSLARLGFDVSRIRPTPLPLEQKNVAATTSTRSHEHEQKKQPNDAASSASTHRP